MTPTGSPPGGAPPDLFPPPAASRAGATECGGCGTQLAPALLACPSCGVLTRAAELTSLAAAAEAAERGGDLAGASGTWREALALLPATAPQRAAIVARLDELTRRIDAAPLGAIAGGGPQTGGALKRVWGGVGAVLLVVLSKGKLLLLGLTKAKTIFSMLAFLGVYWQLYGWPLALGFVVSLYIHEMGHVAALARYGIKASAPMFVPGFGAFVRLDQAPANAREDAVIGLAGPLWGLGAALAAGAVFAATGRGVWGAIAHLGALLNLFNLLPVWQLDGARGFRALSRRQRWVATVAVTLAALAASQGLLFLVALVCGVQAWRSRGEEAGDGRTLATFVALVVTLTAVTVATRGAPGP